MDLRVDYEKLLNELEKEKGEVKKVIYYLEKILLGSQEWKAGIVGGVSLFRDLSSLRETHLKMIQEQVKILKEMKEKEQEVLDEYLNKMS